MPAPFQTPHYFFLNQMAQDKEERLIVNSSGVDSFQAYDLFCFWAGHSYRLLPEAATLANTVRIVGLDVLGI